MKEQKKNAKEQAETKAQELSEQLGVKVHPLVFKENEDSQEVIGYIKEPSRAVKMAVLDKSIMGGYSAAAEMLDIILIKEHSDPRIYSERNEDDKIYLGAVMAAYDLVKFSSNLAKKKS
jgi:Fe2+ transport system protein B